MARRVIHVLDVPSLRDRAPRSTGAIAALACAEACAATPEFEHVVTIVGSRADAEAAAGLGVRASALSPLPLGSPALAGRSLRRALRAAAEDARIQPWSDRAARACDAARLPTARFPADLLPSVSRAVGPGREELRARFGLAPDIPTIALLADPPWHADARRFVYMVGLLDVAGERVAGLVGSGTASTQRARRFHAEAAVGWRMVLADDPVSAVVQACDLAVIVPPAPHRPLSPCDRACIRWSILRSHLLGVPVIGGAEWLDGGVCPDEARGALVGASASITDLGRRLTRLVADGAERQRLSSAVRTHAGAGATRERYGAMLSAHWGLALRARPAPSETAA
ncbi:MAG TPA: hypothetical protein VFF69_04480 [Phycisphaerales bacterium]|nr:hypothetical protein [Phycisphaerales bacterium]